MTTITVSSLLRLMVEQGASDLHISAGEAPMLRVRGDLVRAAMPELPSEDAHRLVLDVMNEAQRRTFQEKLEVNFAYAPSEELRFRVSAFVQNRGDAAVFRCIPQKIPRMEELGLPPALAQLCTAEAGLVLVTGPAGSGKSTTVASMLDLVNESLPGHIITVEDPIELVHRSKRCLVHQREVGSQTRSFDAALRSALREDPDVILIGELRDLETIQLALTAAEAGHLVFATMYTPSARKTADRIIEAFPPGQQAQVRTRLSESLLGVATQMLIKKKGGGRVAALEVLTATPAVRNLIREGKTHQIPSALQVGARFGMQTMEAAILSLVERQVVTIEEARLRMPASEALAAFSGVPA